MLGALQYYFGGNSRKLGRTKIKFIELLRDNHCNKINRTSLKTDFSYLKSYKRAMYETIKSAEFSVIDYHSTEAIEVRMRQNNISYEKFRIIRFFDDTPIL